MKSYGTFSRKALLCHLDDGLAQELKPLLLDPSIGIEPETYSSLEECRKRLAYTNASIVFCPYSLELLRELPSLAARNVTVLVFSRIPSPIECVDVMNVDSADDWA